MPRLRRRYGTRRLSSRYSRSRRFRNRSSSIRRKRGSRRSFRKRSRFGAAGGLLSGRRAKFVFEFTTTTTGTDPQYVFAGNVPSDINASASARTTPNLWVSKAGAYRRWMCLGSKFEAVVTLPAPANPTRNAKLYTLGVVPTDAAGSVAGLTTQQLQLIPGFSRIRPYAGNVASRFLRFKRYASSRSVLGYRPSFPDDAFQYDNDWNALETKRTWFWMFKSSNFDALSDTTAAAVSFRITYYCRLFNPTDLIGT